jgi:hypothetical protein
LSDAGRKIIAALKEAVVGNLARVTIEGVTWIRKEELSALEWQIDWTCGDITGCTLRLKGQRSGLPVTRTRMPRRGYWSPRRPRRQMADKTRQMAVDNRQMAKSTPAISSP